MKTALRTLTVALLATAAAHAQITDNLGTTPTPDTSAPATFNQSQKGFLGQLREKFSLGYYFSILGPSPGRRWGETWNFFDEQAAPYQMFHSANLRWQINPDWAVGATLSYTNDFTGRAQYDKWVSPFNGQTYYYYNDPDEIWYNARAYVGLPALGWSWATLFSTVAIEFPTSNGSRRDDMEYGLVVSENLALRTPSLSKVATGVIFQIIDYKFERNVLPPSCTGCSPIRLQNTLVNVTPYFNYAVASQWQIATQIALDWAATTRARSTSTTTSITATGWRSIASSPPTPSPTWA